MDDAVEVRADLRSYALRRCIRFYAAILVTCIAWTGAHLTPSFAASDDILHGGAALIAVIAAVEVASMGVMLQMAKARARLGGPETLLWAFAQGPWPSLVAAGFFVALAVGLLWAAA
ncbi:MAG TPA: hypothetical protein VNX21_02270 [Candidatus Thermoplasmatota archaeon]|nr:hypothetical protein [Candidatus Thermoplasmatota archaeon]